MIFPNMAWETMKILKKYNDFANYDIELYYNPKEM